MKTLSWRALAALICVLTPLWAQAQIVLPGGGSGGGGGSITFPQTVGGTTFSGGIPYLSNTTTLSSSAALTANAIILGGGAGAAPFTTTTGLNVVTTLAAAVNASGGLISPTPTRAGDIVYWNGTNWVTLAGNNSGTNFLSETSAGVPSWSAGASGVSSFSSTCPASGPSTGAVTFTNTLTDLAKTTSYTGSWTTDCGAAVKFTLSGAATYTLPAPSTDGNYISAITNVSTSTSALTIAAASGTINGAASISLAVNQSISVWCDTTNCYAATLVPSSTPTGPGYSVNNYYVGANIQGAASAGNVFTTGTAFCTPYWLLSPLATGGGSMTIGSLFYRVTTLGTTTATAALYGDQLVSGVHRPGTLLGFTAAAANTSVATDGGALNAGVSVTAGLDWMCVTQGDSIGKIAGVTIGENLGLTGNTSNGSIWANTGSAVTFSVTYTGVASTTWPASAGATFSEASNGPPYVLFQISSIP